MELKSENSEGTLLYRIAEKSESGVRGFSKRVDIGKTALYRYFKQDKLEPEVKEKVAEKLGTTVQELFSQVAGTGAAAPKSQDEIVNKYGVRFERLQNGRWRMTNKRVPFAAHAAYMAGWGDPEYVETLPEHYMVVDAPTEDNYITFPVLGECQDDGSREGLHEGEAITGQSVPRSMWQYKLPFKAPNEKPLKVKAGEDEFELVGKKRYTYWILISPKLGMRIAMIKEHNERTGVLYCTCRNPDKKKHPDFEVRIEECNQIFFGIAVERPLD